MENYVVNELQISSNLCFLNKFFLNSFDMLNIISLSLSFQVYLFDINNGIFSFLWSHVQSLSRFYSRICSIHTVFFIFLNRPSNSMYYEISLQKKKLMLSVHTQKKFSLITLKDVLLLNHFTSSFSTSYYFHTKNLEPLLRIITSYMKKINFSAPFVNFLSFLIC